MRKADELKPCPFCGSPAVIVEDDGVWIVACKADCEACPTVMGNESGEATAAVWNRRTPEDRETLIAAADELQDFASAEWTQRREVYKGYAQRLARYHREFNTSMAIVTKLREMAGS